MPRRRYAPLQFDQDTADTRPHHDSAPKQPDTVQRVRTDEQITPSGEQALGSGMGRAAGPGRQSAVLRMHRTMGNAAISRALAGERRTFQADVFKGDTKLEQVLNDEGRLNRGQTGDPVRKVQEALIRDGEELPRFGADGSYGGETETAVKRFKAKHNLGSVQFGDVGPGTMAKLDELNVGGNAPPPQPKKDPNDVNPELEATLDHIGTDYVKMLRHQDQALVDFERDMAKPETDNPSIFTNLLKLAADKLISHLIPPPGGLLFQGVMGSFKLKASDDESSVIAKAASAGIEKIFSAIDEEAKKRIAAELDSLTVSDGISSLQTFVDAQRNAMFDATIKAMDALSSSKPDLRKWQTEDIGKEDTIGTHADPRFDRALKLRLSVMEKIGAAKEAQYLSTVQQWSAYQAQITLGTTPTINPNGKGDVQGTNLSDPKLAGAGRTSVAGLLDIRIDNLSRENATQPIRVVSARVRGLSEKVREKLNTTFATKKLSEIGFPRRVMDGLPPFTQHDIRIGRNEMNTETFRTGEISDEGRAWLEERGGSESAGMVVVMDEIDNMTVAQLGGIQAPAAELV
jgi:hypothetical protein